MGLWRNAGRHSGTQLGDGTSSNADSDLLQLKFTSNKLHGISDSKINLLERITFALHYLNIWSQFDDVIGEVTTGCLQRLTTPEAKAYLMKRVYEHKLAGA